MTEQFDSHTISAQPKSNPIKKVIIPILIIVVAIAIFMVMINLAPKPEKKSVEIKPPLVNVEPIKVATVALKVYSQGTVIPNVESTLTAEVSGRIIEVAINFDNGAYFKKDQVIAKINDDVYQVNLLQAQARLEVAKAALLEEQARGQQAKDEWRLSGKSLDEAPLMALRKPQLQKAKADLAVAEAEVKAANIQLAKTIIRAPYGGIIKNKMVDIGQFVNTGTALAEIFSAEKAKVRLPIKLQDINYLNLPTVNQPHSNIKVELNSVIGLDNFTWQAELTGYEGEVDNTSRVHYVIATIADPYNIQQIPERAELRVGSFVNAVIEGKTIENLSVLPRSAVVGKNTLYLMTKDKTLNIVDFTAISADQHFIYSKQNFGDNQQLVLTEIALPVSGMPLRVKEIPAQAAEENN